MASSVLFIDDDVPTRLLVTAHLSTNGFPAIGAPDNTFGLHLVRTNRFEHILLASRLGSQGFVYRAMLNDPKLRQRRIIVLGLGATNLTELLNQLVLVLIRLSH